MLEQNQPKPGERKKLSDETTKARLTELEARLARAEHEVRRWKSVLNELPGCVSITRGPEHVFEFVNPTYEVVSRTPNVTGKRLVDTVPELKRQGILGMTDRIFAEGVPVTNRELPVEQDLPDGKKLLRYFSGAFIPLKSEKGDVEGLINFQFDVTDTVENRKLGEKSRERLDLAAEFAHLALWEWDPTVGIMWNSESLCRVFGYPRPIEWNYEIYLRHIHPDDREKIIEAHAKQNGGKVTSDFEHEYRVIWPDGSIHWLKDKGRSIKDADGNLSRVIGATIDITFQKEAETALKASKEAAEIANLAKTHFLANMSHELRTPLAAVIGFAGLLLSPELDPTKSESYTQAIERNGIALCRIIDDILDFSKIESGHLEIINAPFNLGSLMKEVHDITQLEARKKKLSLSFDPLLMEARTVETDRGRLRQILLNVIGNAIKFTPTGSVAVEMKVSKDIEISVRDTGIGISTADRKKLFQPFTQADSTTSRRFGGTGLGLAISRRLARAMDGDVTLVQSDPNQGSTFMISLRA